MANNNVQNVRFLRNGSLYATRSAALEGLNGQSLSAEKDGSIILARYGSGTDVKTLVGLVYFADSSNKSLTIFDVEGSSADVDALRAEINSKLGTGITSGNTATAQLTALSGTSEDASGVTSVWGAKNYAKAYTDEQISGLDYTDTAETGSYVSAVNEADGKISVSRVALPTVAAISAAGKPITAVSESLGAISATAGTINAEYVDIADSGSLISATTVEGALAEIAAEIDAMDKAADAVSGQVVTTVSETDGKVSETKANVKDLQLGGYAKTNDTGDIASADTINVALSKLENKAAAITITNDDNSINVTTSTTGTNIDVNIKSGEHVLAKGGNAGLYTDIKLSGVTPSSTTVKEEYSLVGTDGTVLGDNIKIYKDSSVVSIEYITDSGDTHYQNLKYTYIDVSGNTQTEYVDISSLVLEAEFASGVTVTNHVAHGVVDSNSEKNSGGTAFLTVGADGFKVSGIKQEIIDRINELDADLSGNTAHVTVGVKEDNGKITAVTVAESDIASQSLLDALSAKTVTEVASSNASISATTSVTSDGTVKYDLVTDASKVKMTGFTAAESGFTGITTASTVTEAVKSIETEVLKNEETVSAALNDLDGRIDTIESDFVETVKVNNVALTETDNAVNVQISAAAGSGADNAALAVNTDSSTGAVTLSLLGLDCGTY